MVIVIIHSYQKQRGVALAVSLVLLVALTILGVATLTSTRLQEQITSNAQQKAVSFEAAESAINTVIVDSTLIIDTIKNTPKDQYNNPEPIFPAGYETLLSSSFDQSNSLGVSLDITSSVSIQYCGERGMSVGTELSGDKSKVRMVAMTFDVNGKAQVANSKANSDHIQRGSIPRPETQRQGACATPMP